MTLPNPKGKLVCCLLCGRDTRSKWATCSQCSGGETNGRSYNYDELEDEEAAEDVFADEYQGDVGDDV